MVPTNLGSFSCKDIPRQYSKFFPSYIERSTNNDVYTETPLNQMGIRLDGSNLQVVSSGCGGLGWISPNPLTVNANTGQRMVFDRPPYTGKVAVGDVCRDEIYDNNFADYQAKVYQNYMDMKTGDVQYWVDQSSMAPYRNPVYASESVVDNYLFVTPNHTVWPRYGRTPLDKCSGDSASCYGRKRCQEIPKTLSFINDTMLQREDITSLQSGKINRQNWQYRYGPTLFQNE